jgi:protein involved in temperature-dependent protein secretion
MIIIIERPDQPPKLKKFKGARAVPGPKEGKFLDQIADRDPRIGQVMNWNPAGDFTWPGRLTDFFADAGSDHRAP